MKAVHWRIIPFIVFALLVIFLWRGLSLDPHNLPSAQLGKSLPEFRVPSLGDSQKELTHTTFRGQIALLNVWASWCAACVDEQVFLLQLAREGVAIYGLNYKDNTQEATQWLAAWGNPYKMVGNDADGKVAIDLGVYGAPETFLVDRAGIILYRHAGVLNATIWQREFLPRILELEHKA